MGRRAADADVTEPRVRVRAPDDDRVEHAGSHDVVDVASAAGEERRVLEPLDGGGHGSRHVSITTVE
jgi:hypothetical protein